jgi:hypothetical protein
MCCGRCVFAWLCSRIGSTGAAAGALFSRWWRFESCDWYSKQCSLVCARRTEICRGAASAVVGKQQVGLMGSLFCIVVSCVLEHWQVHDRTVWWVWWLQAINRLNTCTAVPAKFQHVR